MKKILNLLFVPALFCIMIVACQSPQGEANTEKGVAEETKPSNEATKKAEPPKAEATLVLNANLATEANLNEIGLSAETVAQILEKRPFLSMNDFDGLLGAADNKAELYKKIFVPFNLNTTAEQDFKMIPGVGDRMAHEFQEYKPYASIKQFERDMGKYVDDAEVARYKDYVFVPVELNTASEDDIKALPGIGDRMAHEFEEYRPYSNMAQFNKSMSKYVDEKELARLERLVYLKK